MSTGNIYWGVKATSAYGWQLYHLQVLIVLKSWGFNLLEPSGPVQVCNGILLSLPIILCKCISWQKRSEIWILAVMNMECGLVDRYWHFGGDTLPWKKDWAVVRDALAPSEPCPLLSATFLLCGSYSILKMEPICWATVLVSVHLTVRCHFPLGLKIQIFWQVMLCHSINKFQFEGRFQASAVL